MPNFCPPRPAALELFNFEGTTPVRVVLGEDGKPLFVAKDVAEALGYRWNGTAAISHVPEMWRGVRTVLTPSGSQEMATLTDMGLNFFLARSDKPKALPFQLWIAGEVVPSIMRTGSYSVAPARSAAEALLLRPSSEVLRLAAALAEENERQAKQIAAQARVIEEQRPAKEFVDRFVAAKGSAGVRQVAKRIGRQQNELVAELLRDKVLYRSEGKLTPFAEYEGRGYFVVKNGEKNGKAFGHARFTTEGIAWAAKRYGRATPEVEPTELAPSPRQGSLL